MVISRYLATASSDHTVKIWNVDGFTLEKTLVGMYLTRSTTGCRWYLPFLESVSILALYVS